MGAHGAFLSHSSSVPLIQVRQGSASKAVIGGLSRHELNVTPNVGEYNVERMRPLYPRRFKV
jgi:hypothetical protein